MFDSGHWSVAAVVGLVMAGTVAGTVAFEADADEPHAAKARLLQLGSDLELGVTLRDKAPRAYMRDGGRICLRVRTRKRAIEDICTARRTRDGHVVTTVRRLSMGGRSVRVRRLPATTHVRGRHVSLRFLADDAGLGPEKLRWQLYMQRAPRTCTARFRCSVLLPEQGFRVTRIRRLAGCRASGPSMRRSGSGRRVALTFDDGPSAYTPGFLKTLDRYNARATFFVVGRQIGGRGSLLKEMLRRGHTIGNHSFAHRSFPSAADIAHTSHVIAQTSGYSPCMFRAPYGSVNSSLIAAARAQGMLTIGWNDDPADYSRPAARTIASRVLGQARAGSIVVLHDGGGVRAQTLAALPSIIKGLRKRGYEPVSLTELLGLRPRYQ